jgi:hypothetical protein
MRTLLMAIVMLGLAGCASADGCYIAENLCRENDRPGVGALAMTYEQGDALMNFGAAVMQTSQPRGPSAYCVQTGIVTQCY